MEEKSLADFVKESPVSPTVEELLDGLHPEQNDETNSYPEPETVLIVLDSP